VTTSEDLMLDVRGGSRGAFETLFERYRGPIWRFFRRRLADPAGAEELTQDVFLAVLQAAERYEARAPFRVYLFGIAYNVLLADRRKAGHRGAFETLDGELPSPASADLDSAMWVRAALSALDPDDRDILMLREYEQLSYQEIADVRGIPLNTVRSRLFRARITLKAALLATVDTGGRTGHDA
jgi:RNA polymerase sigma-70 factor (ECF subfamily)